MNMLPLKADQFITLEKCIRQQCKQNKLKIIAPAWKDEFGLPGGSYSVSDIQDNV